MFTLPTEEMLDELYKKSELQVSKHPARFQFTLFLYTLWGFVYLLLILTIACVLGILAFFFTLSGFLGFLIFFFCLYFSLTILWQIPKMFRLMAKMFWLIRRPTNSVCLPKDSPLVYKVQKLCSDMHLTRPKNIYLTADSNAWITNVGSRDSLFIGVPFFAILNEDELTSILVHELAHITLHHGIMGRFFFNTTLFWRKIEIAMQEGFFLSTVNLGWLRHFFINFTARIGVKTAVMNKKNVFAADKLAGKAIGAKTTAQTLALIHIFAMAEDMNSIWNDYFKKAAETNQEPPTVSDFLYETIQSLDPSICARLFQACMNRETEPQGSHPSLKSRLENLAQTIDPPNFTDTPAYNHMLSSEDQTLWNQTVNQRLQIRWAHEKKRLCRLKTERKSFETSRFMIPFSILYELLPYKELLEAARLQIQTTPQDAHILYLLGKEQLYAGNESGLQMILSAMEQNNRFRDLARYEIITYFKHYRSKEELNYFSQRNAHLMTVNQAKKPTNPQFENNHGLFTPLDIFHTREISLADMFFGSLNEISEIFLDELKGLVNQFPLIKKARLLNFSNCYILIIHYKAGWQRRKYDEVRQEFIESVMYAAFDQRPLPVNAVSDQRPLLVYADFDHRPLPVHVLSNSQLLKKRKLRYFYRIYSQRIK